MKKLFKIPFINKALYYDNEQKSNIFLEKHSFKKAVKKTAVPVNTASSRI